MTHRPFSHLLELGPIFSADPKEARKQCEDWLSRGASLFVVGTDKLIFADAAARYASALK